MVQIIFSDRLGLLLLIPHFATQKQSSFFFLFLTGRADNDRYISTNTPLRLYCTHIDIRSLDSTQAPEIYYENNFRSAFSNLNVLRIRPYDLFTLKHLTLYSSNYLHVAQKNHEFSFFAKSTT